MGPGGGSAARPSAASSRRTAWGSVTARGGPSTCVGDFHRVFLPSRTMASKATNKKAVAHAAWCEMARGMCKFIAVQIRRAVEDGTPRDASFAYIKEQIGIAIADAAGRLCIEGPPLVLTSAECLELTNIGDAMQGPREQTGRTTRRKLRLPKG